MDNKNQIKYICYYNHDQSTKRNCAPSAVNKIDYIAATLCDIGYNVDIISVSQIIEPKFRFYKATKCAIKDKIYIKYFPSIGGTSKLIKIIRNIWHRIALFIFLLFNTKKDERIIAYHSLGYRYVLTIARFIKRFHLIYEVEEVYTDVIQDSIFNPRKMELKMISNADAYIFPTELLNDKFNVKNKPYTIIYGSYQFAQTKPKKNTSDTIHVVYAGTFDPRKGGAVAAVAAAKFLPKNYHVHICGFGSDDDVQNIINVVNTTSQIANARVSYEGLKFGQEYINFIQLCDIGLSTQDPNALFNHTSFPSKILSYMSNGLSVVSIDIPAIKRSKLSKYISFYEKQDAEHIAQAIIKTDIHNNNIDLIRSLDSKFKKDIERLINK